jgi:putative addiction module component (TIGR02574 family)
MLNRNREIQTGVKNPVPSTALSAGSVSAIESREGIEWAADEVCMAQMTSEVSKLLEQALSLSVEEQEALADSLISNLGGKVDERVQAAWDAEIEKRIAELDSGRTRTIPWAQVRRRNLEKLPDAH